MLTRSLVVAFVATAVQAAQQDGISMEPPVLPHVDDITFSGAGCLPGTATTTWSTAGWSDWTINLHGLNLEATTNTGGIGRFPSSSECTIHAHFSQASAGWQLALEAVSIRGYAALSSGSSFGVAAGVSWTSAAAASPAVARNVSLTNTLPSDSASAIGAMLDFSSVAVWSDCSTSPAADLGNLTLKLNFGVHVQQNATSGYAAFGGLVDDGHGELSAAPAVIQRLQWAWRACEPPAVPWGATTFHPKPKTTTTTAAANATASGNSTVPAATTTPVVIPPFANSTSVTSGNFTWPTQPVTTNKTGSGWPTSTPTFLNTSTTVTPITDKFPTTLSTVTTAPKPWTNSTTTEPHWTNSTTAATVSTTSAPNSTTGSVLQTSIPGTSYSFSFIDDPTDSTTTAAVLTTTTNSPPWTNSTSTGSTSQTVPLPMHT